MTSVPAIRLLAPCKVNLVLRIEGRREDGYHTLTSIFLPLAEPHDVLTVSPGETGEGLSLSCPGIDEPAETNLVHKAYVHFAAATGFAPDLRVSVSKDIPTGAGLGGGSSDAAAMLSHLNSIAGRRALLLDELAALALSLGADVPFFLLGRPALARGVGEVLTPIEVDLSGFTLLLVCPPFHVNTAWAYRAFDEAQGHSGRSLGLMHVLTAHHEPDTGSFCLWPGCLENDFEAVVFRAFPALRRIKDDMVRSGAAGVVMSGSGASILGLFRSADDAARTARFLSAQGSRVFAHGP